MFGDSVLWKSGDRNDPIPTDHNGAAVFVNGVFYPDTEDAEAAVLENKCPDLCSFKEIYKSSYKDYRFQFHGGSEVSIRKGSNGGFHTTGNQIWNANVYFRITKKWVDEDINNQAFGLCMGDTHDA
jgi:hypothetical protein